MTSDILHYCIAFAKDAESPVYRWQAKTWLTALIEVGQFDGPIILFTNWADRPLSRELPAHLAERVEEIILDFNDFSNGMNGKLPSCRFRIHVYEYLKHRLAEVDHVFYHDTDAVCRKPLAELFSQRAEIMAPEVKGRNMLNGRWFGAHITDPQQMELASRKRGIQGGSYLIKADLFQAVCATWAALDALPGRDGLVATDQSSLNLLALQCELGILPWKFTAWGPAEICCPETEQRKQLGDALDSAYIWHWWAMRCQYSRVRHATSEFERRRVTPALW